MTYWIVIEPTAEQIIREANRPAPSDVQQPSLALRVSVTPSDSLRR